MNPGQNAVRLVGCSIAAVGMAAVMTQLALMREMLCVFIGNELVLGVILGNWLLLTGVGAWLGRRSDRMREPLWSLACLQVLLALLPLLQIAALRTLRNVVFLPGAAVGVDGTVISSFLLLLPFCLLSGYMLALGCACLREQSAAWRIYFTDSVGSILGGAGFSFFAVRWLDHFALLCVPAAVNLAVAGLLAWKSNRRQFTFAAAFLSAVALAATFLGVDTALTREQYAPDKLLFSSASPYGKLVVTEAAGQLNFFENGVPFLTSRSLEQVEETVHFALAQRPDASRVLLLSGGISGTAREILKYGVREVTYVELDPQLLEAGRKFLPACLSDARIRVVSADARQFVRRVKGHYDVVIVDVPAPSTLHLNRFFTAEFFRDVSDALSPGGVLSFALGTYENYVSPELARVVSCAHQTLGVAFKRVLALPAGRIFFLASNGELHTDIADRLERKGISTRLVNRHYLDAMLAPERVSAMRDASLGSAAINRDFRPALYYFHLQYWRSQFQEKFVWVPVLALLAIAVYLLRQSAPSLTMFASGFAGASLELVLLLAMQVLCGSLYHQLGIVVTCFMAGLAFGAFWTGTRPGDSPRALLARLALGITGLAVAMPLILLLLTRAEQVTASSRLVQIAIPTLAFSLAVLAGAQFPLANRPAVSAAPGHGHPPASPTTVAAGIYCADFLGACLGAFLAGAWLLPVLGLTPVCLLVASLNFAAAVALWRTRS